MRAILILLCLLPQDDPFKTLIDPARRADEGARKTALDSLRSGAAQNPSLFLAARFLEKSDRQWKLVNDKAVRDPAAADFEAYLTKFWASAPGDEKQHLEGLAALAAAGEKWPKSEAGPELFRHFAMAHLAALGDKGAAGAARLGLVKETDRWGRREDAALYAIAKGFSKPAYIPAEVERAAKGSSFFAPRYVAALLEIQKTFFANTGYEALYKSLPGIAGPNASKAAVDHLKMLAEGIKAATACGNCKAGKVDCQVCQGKKRTDIKCPVCKGLGWSQKGDKANVLIPCVNCRGICILKNVGCPPCKQSGTVECIVCAGKGWRDNFRGCRDCRICALCHGKRQMETPCATCGGKGRVPPIVAGIPTILCGDCKGNALLKGPCKACAESGLDNCAKCGGKGTRDGKSPERPGAAHVYVTDPCDRCGGKGWPIANVALPCDRCVGLGIRIKPSLDPTRVLE